MTMNIAESQVVLFAEHSGDGGTFKTIKGVAGVVRTLTEANWIASEWFNVGAFQTLALYLFGDLSNNAATCKVRVEGRFADPNNPGAFTEPHLIDTARTDDPSSAPAKEQTIAAADFKNGTGAGTDQVSDWDGTADGAAAAAEALSVKLLTTDAVLTSQVRVLLKAGAAPAAGDKMIVGVNRG